MELLAGECGNHSRLLVGMGGRQFRSVLSTELNVLVKVTKFHQPTRYMTPHNFTPRPIQRRMWFGRRPVTVEDGFDHRKVHVGFVESKVALR